MTQYNETDIAIIGMEGRFPGSKDLQSFWCNIQSMADCVTRTQVGSLLSGEGLINDLSLFDADFFGFSREEAQLLDPQHRLMLQAAWHSLEDAGIVAGDNDDIISVYLGCAPSTYWSPDETFASLTEHYQAMTSNLPDFVATRISYKLDLKGESMLVGTGCSSSLVAIHLACQSLLSGQSTVALAGGVTLLSSDRSSVLLPEDGMILSKTARCRPFDNAANGTVPASGLGIVVLKPALNALQDGDLVHAIIKATAVNNDGSNKNSFMAPSVEGQAEAIATALELSNVAPDSIGYIETHGTGTRLGDPIEIEALNRAFAGSETSRSCALGSLKANFGHLDRAAGVAGLIKAVCCLKNKVVPGLKHFEILNSEIDLSESPFYIPSTSSKWESENVPRRACVSAFGVGGTNAHVVLEEVGEKSRAIEEGCNKRTSALLLSARSLEALEVMQSNLAEFLEQDTTATLHEVESTCAFRRAGLPFRASVVAGSKEEAAKLLRSQSLSVSESLPNSSQVVFLFPGHGASAWAGSKAMYRDFPLYRSVVDQCLSYLPERHCDEIRSFLTSSDVVDPNIRMTIAQPLLFIWEVALAKLLLSYGVRPAALLGHSMGEVSAACLSGVFSLEEGLALVLRRGELFDDSLPGGMLSVDLPLEGVRRELPEELSVSVVNHSNSTVVSGPFESLEEFKRTLSERSVEFRDLNIKYAAHSANLDKAIEPLNRLAATMDSRSVGTAFVSNVSGALFASGDTLPVDYWGQQLRSPVLFYEGVKTLLSKGCNTFIEVGPGAVLGTVVGRIADELGHKVNVFSTMPRKEFSAESQQSLIGALAGLWGVGACNASTVVSNKSKSWTRIPKYPFQERSYWRTTTSSLTSDTTQSSKGERFKDSSCWLYKEVWSKIAEASPALSALSRGKKSNTPRALVRTNNSLLAKQLISQLRERDVEVIEVPDTPLGNSLDLIHALSSSGSRWNFFDFSLCTDVSEGSFSEYRTLLEDIQLLGAERLLSSCSIWMFSQGLRKIEHQDSICPWRSLVVGLEKVVPQEFIGSTWHSVDVDSQSLDQADLVPRVLSLLDSCTEHRYGIRSGEILASTFEYSRPSLESIQFRDNGTYVVTGGGGKVGKILVESILERSPTANLLIANRTVYSDESPQTGAFRLLQERFPDSNISFHSVDVSQEDCFTKWLNDMQEEYGKIAGIVHSAANVSTTSYPFISEISQEKTDDITGAKIIGASAIAKASEKQSFDFVILCSSISTEIGGVRFSSYISANSFLDALAVKMNKANGTIWKSIAWEAWDFGDSEKEGNSELKKLALSPDDGRELFYRALNCDATRVLTSTMSLSLRLKHIRENHQSLGQETDLSPHFLLADIESNVRSVVEEQIGSTLCETGSDSLLSLGYDSLLTMRLVVRLRKLFSIALPIASVKGSLSVAELISLCKTELSQSRPSDPTVTSATQSLLKAEKKPRYLASSLQRRWFLVEPSRFGYLDIPLVIKGRLDLARLNKALEAVIQRHSILSTIYSWDGSDLWQIPGKGVPSIQLHDLSSCPKSEIQSRTEIYLSKLGHVFFDFEKEVPWRAQLLKLSEEEHILHFHFHHILMDGTSSTIFLTDLSAAYKALGNGLEPFSGKSMPLQYTDYSEWHQRELDGSYGETLRNYWLNHHESSSEILLLHNSLDNQEDNLGEEVLFSVSQSQTSSLKELQAAFDISLFDTFFAIYVLFLMRLKSKSDFVLGTTLAGRNHVGLDEILGVFVTPLPVRASLEGCRSLKDFFLRANSIMGNFHEHQQYPLESMVKEVPPFTSSDINNSFRVYILMQNYPKAEHRLDDLTYERLDVDHLFPHYLMRDFELTLVPEDEKSTSFSASFAYRKALFSKDTVESWSREFGEFIDELLSLGINGMNKDVFDFLGLKRCV